MTSVDEKLKQLEKEIRQLQIEYGAYFAGGRPRPPSDTEWRVQNLIKQFSDMGRRLKYAHRFRYNNLAARYAKFSEIWRQRSRRMEEGRTPFGYSRVARALEQERLADAARQHEARVHGEAVRVAICDPLKEAEKVQSLFHTLLEAKRKVGEASELNFEQFHKFVRKKTDQLKKQMRCQQVEYAITVEGGEVKLKAKAS
ncbi:MAG: MXAN_5187 C-terminal domain-containing protein [Terriglobia bacterium]